MKKTYRVILLGFVALFVLVCVALLFRNRALSRAEQVQNTQPHAEDNRQTADAHLSAINQPRVVAKPTASKVRIAGNDYPVEFEDTALSNNLRERINSDLTTLFSFASSFERLKGQEVGAGAFRPLTLFLNDCEGFFILDDGSKKRVQVNKVFSDKYHQAFALMDAHSKTVQQVKDFIALMNNPSLLSQPTQILRDLCHFGHPASVDEDVIPSDDEVRAIVSEMQQWKYLGISALGFGVEKSPKLGGAEVPIVFVLIVDKNEADPSEFGGYILEFSDGKWREKWMP